MTRNSASRSSGAVSSIVLGPCDAGVVDDDVEAAEPIRRLFDHLKGGVAVDDVAGDRDRFPALPPYLRGHLLSAVPVDVVDGDVRAVLGEVKGDGPPDTASCACDQGDP